MDILAVVQAFPARIKALQREIARLDDEIHTLERRGTVAATPWFRPGRYKYLYLIHPTVDGRRRRKEYVGPDERAQAIAPGQGGAAPESPGVETGA